MKVYLCVLRIIASQVLIGWHSFFLPFGRDQSEYATLGWLFLEGATIYVDFFSVKPPGSHLVHAMALWLFGHDMQAIRNLDFIIIYFLSVGLLYLCQLRFNLRAAVLAVLLFQCTYYQFDHWSQAQTESFQLLPMLLAILLLLYASPFRVFVAGVLAGFAGLFKYPILIVLPLYALYLWSYSEEQKVPKRFYQPIIFLIGSTCPFILFFAHLAYHDGLFEFITMTWEYYSRYVNITDFPVPRVQPALFRYGLIAMPFVGVVALFRSAIVSKSYAHHKIDILLAIMTFGGLTQLVVQRKFNDYHHMILLIPFAYFVTYIYHELSQRLQSFTFVSICKASYVLSLFFIFVAPIILFFPHRLKTISPYFNGEITLEEYYSLPIFSRYDDGGDYSIRAVFETADYLQPFLQPDDRIFIWGFEPGVYFLTKYWPVSRYIYNFLLYPHYRAALYRDDFLRDLVRDLPKLILVLKNDRIPWVTNTTRDSAEVVASFPQFEDILKNDYEQIREIEDFMIYRRK